jgi:hypothetical protein
MNLDPIALLLESEAKGALPNGTRITKVAEDKPNEGTPLGSSGVVIASHAAPPDLREHAHFFYFVEWDYWPGQPVGVVDWKIRAA